MSDIRPVEYLFGGGSLAIAAAILVSAVVFGIGSVWTHVMAGEYAPAVVVFIAAGYAVMVSSYAILCVVGELRERGGGVVENRSEIT